MSANFAPDDAQSIIEHMNTDHADAVLAIARAYGNDRHVPVARLVGITPFALDVEIGDESARSVSKIPFDPPIDPLHSVRSRLVALTRSARELLAGELDSADSSAS